MRRTRDILQVHQIDYYLEMVKSLGLRSNDRSIQLQLGGEAREISAKLLKSFGLQEDQLLIGMAPGATYGPAKKWPAERFAEVAGKLLRALPARILLFGSEADRPSTELVQHRAGGGLIDIAGKTNLRDAMILISKCALFISNDSGLMHVAGALGVPTIAIFGSTNPVTTSPAGEKSLVIRKEISCSPCLRKECPTDFRCMTSITADEVYGSNKEHGSDQVKR